MSETAEPTAPQQRVIGRPFKPGVSGNPSGRKPGSRGKLSESFLADLAACWERNGIAALERCAQEQPDVLIKTIASLLPRDVRLDLVGDAASFARTFEQAVAMLGGTLPPRHRPPLPGQPKVIDHVRQR